MNNVEINRDTEILLIYAKLFEYSKILKSLNMQKRLNRIYNQYKKVGYNQTIIEFNNIIKVYGLEK